MKFTPLFCLILVVFSGISFCFGQGGFNCGDAVELVPDTTCNYTSYESDTSAMWFIFTASAENVKISIVTQKYGLNLPHIHNLGVYSGECNSPILLLEDNLPFIDSADMLSVDLVAYGLQLGNEYYIRADRVAHSGACTQLNCTVNNSSDQATFDICIQNLFVVIPSESTEYPNSQRAYEENNGQLMDLNGDLVEDVLFFNKQFSPSTYLSEDYTSFVWSKVDTISSTEDSIHRIDMYLSKSNTPTIFTSQQLPDLTNYYTQNFPGGLLSNRSFSRIMYTEVYNNIDMHWYSCETGLKLNFVIKPGGDPTDIKLEFIGALSTTLTSGNGFKVSSYLGEMEFRRADIYQVDLSGNVTMLSFGDFYQAGTDMYGIDFNDYDPASYLIVSVEQEGPAAMPGPSDLEWSTYYGGSQWDIAVDMDADSDGNIFVTGALMSTNFPAEGSGIFSDNFNGVIDGYLAKFNSNYSREWMTFMGGDNVDYVTGIDHYNQEAVTYVIGGTQSTSGTFNEQEWIGNSNCYVDDNITDKHGFLCRFDDDGAREWSTFLVGNTQQSSIYRVKVDNDGNVFCTSPAGINALGMYGTYSSTPPSNGDHPIYSTNVNAYQQYGNTTGNSDIAVMKFNDQLELDWSTYLGGTSSVDLAYDLTIDNTNDRIYIAGRTTSSPGTPCSSVGSGGFPVCSGGGYYQDFIAGDEDGFVTSFTDEGELLWSTYFGGSEGDVITGIEVGPSGTIFITGTTMSGTYSNLDCAPGSNGGFPKCDPGSGAYFQPSFGGGFSDVFVASFNLSSDLTWSTFFGGSAGEGVPGSVTYIPVLQYFRGSDIHISTHDFSGGNSVYLFGDSDDGFGSFTFPLQTPQSPFSDYYYQSNHTDTRDNFIARFALSDLGLDWSTFFGGKDLDDEERSGALVTSGLRVYTCGATSSGSSSSTPMPLSCPNTINPYCQSQIGSPSSYDAYIAQFQLDGNVGMKENGINIPHFSDGLNIFPNPTTGEFMILLDQNWHSGQLTVFDQLGNAIFFKKVSEGESEVLINLQEYANGIYLVNIVTDNSYKYAKIIKQ